MKITKRTNLAMRVLMYCAAHESEIVTKADIAKHCNSSENHLAQVINKLSNLGYLETMRGRNGGLRLAHAQTDIVVSAIFRAFESERPEGDCLADTDNSCPLKPACRLKLVLEDALAAFYNELDKVTLDGLMCENLPLFDILCPERGEV